jgi:hypothetical protein
MKTLTKAQLNYAKQCKMEEGKRKRESQGAQEEKVKWKRRAKDGVW